MKSLLNLIDSDISNIPIYIINVKHETKRLENCLKQLQKLSFNNIYIIEAIEHEFAQKNMYNFFFI